MEVIVWRVRVPHFREVSPHLREVLRDLILQGSRLVRFHVHFLQHGWVE